MEAEADFRLDNPRRYVRILEGDAFRHCTVRLSARGGTLHVVVRADNRKSLDSAMGSIRKQIGIVKSALELV